MKKSIICAGLIGLAVITSGFFGQDREYTEFVYTVKPGDTVWTLAEANCGSQYVLSYIDVLKERNPELNDSNLQIHPGDKLILLKVSEA